MSEDRVEQFERIIDTIDEQPTLTQKQWIELLEKVQFEVSKRLARARRDPFAGVLDEEWPIKP